VAVSLSLATHKGSVPVGYRLYLPKEWTDDIARCRQAGVPEAVVFETKPALAMRQIEAALEAGCLHGVVLADAAYGDETAWREQLAALNLTYAVAVRLGTTVWWGVHQPLTEATSEGPVDRLRRRLKRDSDHQPIGVDKLARALPARAWRQVTWREGVSSPMTSCFAQVRVSAAHRDQRRDEEWLIIEWPEGAQEPAHYGFSNLAKTVPGQAMINTVMGRWWIERDDQELKQEMGLGHYEGRNWQGFHHHSSLCQAAYGFLILERLTRRKKPCSIQNASPTHPLQAARGGRPCSVMRPPPSSAAAIAWHAFWFKRYRGARVAATGW
jgi:SRSO17 transposase